MAADFPKSRRLLTSSEFSSVFNATEFRCGSRDLLLLVRSNQLGFPRIGFVLAKKHVKLAVQRNRIKRIVRESFRLQQTKLDTYDYVVMARATAVELSDQQLRNAIDKLWFKLRPAYDNRRKTGNNRRQR